MSVSCLVYIHVFLYASISLQDSETQWKTEREELTAKLDDLRTLYKSTTKKTDSKTKSTETGRAGEEKVVERL